MENDSRKNIIVKGARESNLKNVSVSIPKGTLTVFTGLSGSGKTALAFDTIYQEGQRRYVESLSSYARQFLGSVDKPDVDSIEGLSPAISIDQKTTSHNPRSTVGTVTEIYDYLRLLFARIGVPYCPTHNTPIVSFSPTAMANMIMAYKEGTKVQILSPVVRHEKGIHKETLDKIKAAGFERLRVDGQTVLFSELKPLDKNKRHDIEIVIDRLIVKEGLLSRVYDDVELALNYGNGYLLILTDEGEKLLSQHNCCPIDGFSVPKLEPRLFSFNAPLGYCPECKGLGIKREVAEDLLVPDPTLTIDQGAIHYYKNIAHTANLEWQDFCFLMDQYHIPYDVPWKDLSEHDRHIVLFGSDRTFDYRLKSRSGNTLNRHGYIEGVKTRIERLYRDTSSQMIILWLETYMRDHECTTCHGQRLNPQALSVRVNGLNIAQVCELPIDKFLLWIQAVRGSVGDFDKQVADMILKELESRSSFLVSVGLDYLTLSRMAMTLSGGEAQRIRLATQIGSRLSGVLYVLDEPSIGLHQRDNAKLIASLKEMRDIGNTLIVVEHDEETIRSADYIVDVGPGAGVNGGEIVATGSLADIENCPRSITGDYLSGRKFIAVPSKRRKGNGKAIVMKGCSCHNLKNVNVSFPLGELVLITGVSGSGKSSLINETLYKAVVKQLTGEETFPGAYKSISGLNYIDKVVNVTQDPIGRTPRSNPATYTKVFDDIRALFAETSEAKARGFDKGRFSFNVTGGRCEKCQGAGVVCVPMNFLPDVYVKCDECDGMRYNAETLLCAYKGKNIHDVLEMTVDEAVKFFENRAEIKRKIKTLSDVGLGYIKLGQSATTLSGGEAQRVKLAYELQRRPTGKTLYLLDEPTTGLHADDVNRLIKVLQSIVGHGDTVIVIEHNLDMVKVADYIIDLGPLGGYRGGEIVAEGTPEQVSRAKGSFTGEYLARTLKSALDKGQME